MAFPNCDQWEGMQAVRSVEDCFWAGSDPAGVHPVLAPVQTARKRCLGRQSDEQKPWQGDRPPLSQLLAQVRTCLKEAAWGHLMRRVDRAHIRVAYRAPLSLIPRL